MPVGQDFLTNVHKSTLRPPPAIRHDHLDKTTETSEISSSKAVKIDEEGTMAVDGNNVWSHSTSPIGSRGNATESFVDHEYDTEEGIAEAGILPLSNKWKTLVLGQPKKARAQPAAPLG